WAFLQRNSEFVRQAETNPVSLLPEGPAAQQSLKGLSKEEILQLWERGYQDPRFFLQSYLRDWFPSHIPWVHQGIIAILTRKPDFLLEWQYDSKGNCVYGPDELSKILRHFSWTDP